MTAGHEVIGTEPLSRFGRGDMALWTVAFVVVLVAEAAAMLFLSAALSPPQPPGATTPTIMIELAPIAVAPEAEETPEPVVEPPPPVETPDPVPVEQPPEPVAEPEPIPEPIPQPMEPELPPPESEPVEELTPAPVEPEIAEASIPVPLVAPSSIAEKRQEFAEAMKPKEKARPRTETKIVEPKESKQPAAPADAAPAKQKPSVSPQRWQAQVLSHLNRAKRYPQAARRNGEEGVVQMQFVIDGRGRVLSARIVRSSGSAALDQATLDMVHRASPVPAPPASMGQDRITLTVPINFTLR